MGKVKSATREAQREKMPWGFSRGRGSIQLEDQGNLGSFKLKEKRKIDG